MKRPIAVLIGPQTGSAGETVVISFIRNKRTRLFGQPTWGLTTCNGAFDLIGIVRYHGKIEPDERVTENDKTGADTTISAAVQWIISQR